ncbi:MAG: hypothetical protein ACP5JB_00945 [candidate division WOR-3 bacterium]|jgi:hypothetical protein
MPGASPGTVVRLVIKPAGGVNPAQGWVSGVWRAESLLMGWVAGLKLMAGPGLNPAWISAVAPGLIVPVMGTVDRQVCSDTVRSVLKSGIILFSGNAVDLNCRRIKIS